MYGIKIGYTNEPGKMATAYLKLVRRKSISDSRLTDNTKLTNNKFNLNIIIRKF